MSEALAASRFVTFETGQTRPLALAPDGSRLYALNTPDNRLEILRIGLAGVSHEASVPVGLEPVAVAARGAGEVWVVNHLSDSVSVVDVEADPPRVVRTLWVGDEPRDVVFASGRAFVTTAHRGQHRLAVPAALGGGDPELTTEGVGRADVWVFDAADPGAEPGGMPIRIVSLFGDSPRALAVSPDGGTVYAAVFQSGNRTASIFNGAICPAPGPCNLDGVTVPGGQPGGQIPVGPLPPATNGQGIPGPTTGPIVKHDAGSGQWRDVLGRDWTNAVRFTLPDLDVFAIDADADPPAEIGSWAGVGTILFNLAVNPQSGKVYVSNSDARNEVRFEPAIEGRLHEARITVLDGASVIPRHLNKHIDYGLRPAPAGVKGKSLATPLDMAVSADGATLYVAAFGSSKVGVFSTAALETNSFVPSSTDHITVSGGGPSGLALDEARERLYVLTRFDDSIAVVDLATRSEIQHLALHNPEPPQVVTGRPFLYDATTTSSNGEASCASCHVFGDLDGLAWDLGDPDGLFLINPNPFSFPINLAQRNLHPIKGPMVTQSLRGMAGNGPMHWRGDRTAGANPGGNPLEERANFKEFDVAFTALNGAVAAPSDAEMGAFADFILEVMYPPNPNRGLDDALSPEADLGNQIFESQPTFIPGITCVFCHALSPTLGRFGTDGLSSGQATGGGSPALKTPHLRNLYQKVGRFGQPDIQSTFLFGAPPNAFLGDQIRGFGFTHDGSFGTVFDFLHTQLFDQFFDPSHRELLEAYMLEFETDFTPAVGQQVTLAGADPPAAHARLDLLLARAAAPELRPGLVAATECDLVAQGTIAGQARGFVRLASGLFEDDLGATLSEASLRAQVETPGNELTYTCVPFASGRRIGIDRDDDAVRDGQDNCAARANVGQVDGDGDGVGDACDRCVATPDPVQADFDADGAGDLCDDHCVGTGQVTLAGVTPANAPPGAGVIVHGGGFAPGSELDLDGLRSPMSLLNGSWITTLPAGLAPGPHAARVINTAGCRSLQAVTYTSVAPSSCGLTGAELGIVLAGAGFARRRLRRGRAS